MWVLEFNCMRPQQTGQKCLLLAWSLSCEDDEGIYSCKQGTICSCSQWQAGTSSCVRGRQTKRPSMVLWWCSCSLFSCCLEEVVIHSRLQCTWPCSLDVCLSLKAAVLALRWEEKDGFVVLKKEKEKLEDQSRRKVLCDMEQAVPSLFLLYLGQLCQWHNTTHKSNCFIILRYNDNM